MNLLLATTLFLRSILPFELPIMNDTGTFRSDDHPGAVYLFESYFNNCPYCHQNAGNVDDMANEFSHEPRVIVADLGVDKKDSDYDKWISKHSPNHLVLKDADKTLTRKLGTTGYPSAYVVDCHGNVLLKVTGVWNQSKKNQIRAKLEQALQTQCE